MDSKKLAIICIVIIIGVIATCSFIVLNQPKETQIKFLSNSSLYNGEEVIVQLITENGTPISNQSVNVTLIDANGEKNIQNLVTDGKGKASFTLNGVTIGKYVLECNFGGSNGYKPSNNTTSLEIKEEIKIETKSTNYNNYEYDKDRETTEKCLFTYEEAKRKWGLSKEEVDFHNQVMISRYESQTGKKFYR